MRQAEAVPGEPDTRRKPPKRANFRLQIVDFRLREDRGAFDVGEHPSLALEIDVKWWHDRLSVTGVSDAMGG